ncbi:hypothetical protein CPAV1605_1251 [seawater metagenome]|uniref:Uncharacterized protein n=1 Tax=seawater metagenome TaxID=1561972 RepID=A0A5E8CMI0_9ZZZZ
MSNLEEFKWFINNRTQEELLDTAQKLQEIDFTLNHIKRFVLNKNFSNNDIHILKQKLNKLSIFKLHGVSNKTLYKLCHKFKDIGKQTGGVIGELRTVKSPGLFYENPSAVPFTRKLDQFNLVLDILSFIPYYGSIAALSAFILYFIRGDYEDATFSLISAIQPLGPYLSVPTKYIFKYFENKQPNFRKYYRSLTSLRQATKELESFKIANTNLNNPMNDDFEYEIYDP